MNYQQFPQPLPPAIIGILNAHYSQQPPPPPRTAQAQQPTFSNLTAPPFVYVPVYPHYFTPNAGIFVGGGLMPQNYQGNDIPQAEAVLRNIAVQSDANKLKTQYLR